MLGNRGRTATRARRFGFTCAAHRRMKSVYRVIERVVVALAIAVIRVVAVSAWTAIFNALLDELHFIQLGLETCVDVVVDLLSRLL